MAQDNLNKVASYTIDDNLTCQIGKLIIDSNLSCMQGSQTCMKAKGNTGATPLKNSNLSVWISQVGIGRLDQDSRALCLHQVLHELIS